MASYIFSGVERMTAQIVGAKVGDTLDLFPLMGNPHWVWRAGPRFIARFYWDRLKIQFMRRVLRRKDFAKWVVVKVGPSWFCKLEKVGGP